MGKKPSKASTKIFVDLVTDMLLKRGAIQQPDPFENRSVFHLETRGGLMFITLDRADQYIWTVYGRFFDIARAKKLYPCSNSGKYNIHLSEELTPKQAFDEVKDFYERIK